MYARLTLLRLNPGALSKASEKLGDATAALKAQKGFKSVIFLSNDETDELGSLSVWETKMDAEAAIRALRSGMMGRIGGFLNSPPTTKLFQVQEPEA